MSTRRVFADLLYTEMATNDRIVLLTADLGYGLWDNIRDTYPERFFNVMASEQLMIGCGVGMALEGKIPFCYSITPFLLYRPFEFIRNYLEIEKIPVKLIGGGRGDDYRKLGYTHCGGDDRRILSAFSNIKSCWPESEDELIKIFRELILTPLPYYVNLHK